MNKPKILLVTGKNPLEATGGYQSYTKILAERIKSLEYNVEIYCFGRNNRTEESKIGIIYQFKTRFNIPLFAFPFLALILASKINLRKEVNYIIWGIGPWSLSGALYKFFHPAKNSILISYYPTTIGHEIKGAYPGINIKDHGIIKLEMLLTKLFLSNIYTLFEAFTLSRCVFIIYHYNSIKRILANEFKINPKKQILIPQFLESPPSLKLNSIKSNHPSIVFIGRHDPRKGINFLLHAFYILNHKGIKFNAYIIGDGMLLYRHKKLADNLGLRNVHILGMVKNKEVYLKNADIFVFPTLEEGSSSISILEAMSFKLPIVSSRVDGISEDIVHRKSGILIPPKNPTLLAEALEELLSNRSLARKLGANARKQYLKMYNMQKSNIELKRFIERCESFFQDPNKIRS